MAVCHFIAAYQITTNSMARSNTSVLSCSAVQKSWGFTWLKSRCQQDCVRSGGFRGNFISLSLPASEATCAQWLMALSSVFKASTEELGLSLAALSGSLFQYRPPLLRILVVTLGLPGNPE